MHLLLFLLLPTIFAHQIRSPIVTNFGEFQNWQYCPTGQYAAGISLKVEGDQRGKDDTGLNAIALYCRPYGSDAIEGLPWMTGGEAPWGEWGANKWCPAGTAIIGFQLRSESDQRGGDDVAADNFAAYCGHIHDSRVTQGTPYIQGDTPGWGDWTAAQFCMPGYLVCGISSQIEGDQGGGDDTALNNVKLDCCKVEEASCVPKVYWETIKEVDNRGGADKATLEIWTTVSHTKTTGTTRTSTQSNKNTFHMEFNAGGKGTVKAVEISGGAKFGYAKETMSTEQLQQMVSDTVGTSRTEKLTVSAPQGTRIRVKQLTVTCSENLLKLSKYITVAY